MIATYAAALTVCATSLAIGQALLALCGVRRWSWLAPAAGLATVLAVCWATVRLPGDGALSAALVLALALVAVAYLWGRLEGGGEAVRAGLPVGLLALALASLPFWIEGHFGILGTGFNPDMSQHLLATDRLASGASSQLLAQGYPLGPHAVAVALEKGLGIGLVQGFGGLTVAIAVLAPLTALTAFAARPPLQRAAAALLVGLPYLVASYFAQGAFKETAQALLLLAFVLALRETSRNPGWRELPLRFVPAALIAIGSVYVYSFPGLLWLAGTAAIWLIVELVWSRRASVAEGRGMGASPAGGAVGGTAPEEASATAGGGGSPAVTGPAGLALIVFLVGALPELSRMLDFQRFETFDPTGPGLGNLFGQISPFTALGIWPSGDFRIAPGDGAVPAAVYYLGAAFAAALLVYGAVRCWRRGETAILAGLVAAAGLCAAARLGGTPYTAAKALEVAAPLVALAILLPLNRQAAASSAGGVAGGTSPEEASATAGGGGSPATTGPAATRLVLTAYIAAAGACSLLAFANAPVGPTAYSPALTGLRPLIDADSTLVIAPDELIEEEHGLRYLVWELRGGRVCVETESEVGTAPPPGVRFVVTQPGSAAGDTLGLEPPFRGFELRRRASPYLLWVRPGRVAGAAPCPLIAERQSRAGDD